MKKSIIITIRATRSSLLYLSLILFVLLSAPLYALLLIASASSSALLKKDIKRGTKTGNNFLILTIILPSSKFTPLDFCAFINLSISFIMVGINLKAITSIREISSTGILNILKGFRKYSIESVNLSGEVV